MAATLELDNPDLAGVSPLTLALRAQLAGKTLVTHASFTFGDLTGEVCEGRDSLWAILRRPGLGGLALRLAFAPGGIDKVAIRRPKAGETLRLSVVSAIGEHVVVIRTDRMDLQRLRTTIALIPAVPLLVPYLPRDLYPLDAHDDPAGAVGVVEAGQRGVNSGLLYFHIDEPGFGSVLYFQNLTAMNDYYRATGTKPDGAVGGEWPELGYLPPTPPQSGTPPIDPLPAGKPVTVSDAILVFRDSAATEESDSARRFVQMLGAVYTTLDLPPVEFRDWAERSQRTLADLANSPKATIKHYGHRYAHPYTASEYPDSMVQMALIAPMHDYARWSGTDIPLLAEFEAGLGKFYDPKLKSMRRYLPNVGDDKDKNAVDSWYLYHPLMNLGRLAIAGNQTARSLFERSIDFGIKAAHHFNYKWPIQYKVTDFSVITDVAGADGQGQTDVGGMYAWVMLQAYELSREERFLHEAQAAIDAARGMRFSLNYQANLTAWGAAACMRLWRITNVERYRLQSYVYLASFFHNSAIWESEIDNARYYRNFLGVTCLQDAPYMAIYECFDSFAAFEYYLRDSGPELEPAARMLISEYCKYALDRAWFYYPDALPKQMLADDIRNGHIDCDLSFPLEDLYVGGEPAGQVGQEIYGAGAALVFATRSFHIVDDAPFRLFCDHFILSHERTNSRALSISLDGGENCTAMLSLVRNGRAALPSVTVRTAGGDVLRPRHSKADRIDYIVPASGRLLLGWE
ncbi:hypothetical protein FPZ54_02955 [Sphingomonas suaedae]|uniref:Uncharacterized protein n=1 Tax=Sphingomonas suaedae TaxID=2599297 RepID=A0A518RCE7_9SPHN|nr:hypothetical protein [Sphingomonas suaedae]QDX25084.1 hypothetical protein FPZ54_02955 [Sphingomonas suaedae]